MNFSIDNLHYLDQKLFTENVTTKVIVDWKEYLTSAQKKFSNHSFIVIEKDKAVFIDTVLLNFVHISYTSKTLDIKIDTTLKNSSIDLYILHFNNDKQNINIESKGIYPTTIFHENIICQKGYQSLHINNQNEMNYYHIVNNLTEQLFHQEIEINSYEITNLYFSQKQQDSKNKIDQQINLFSNAILNYRSMNYLQTGQLRDDTVEVIHHTPNTQSHLSYFSLNSGKSVSQINSIITPDAFNSQTHQQIKHILLNENSKSYSKPNLMISNPDVIASHGNSIGSFNLENLFYLQQHGLNKEEAKLIISHSYIQDFCEHTSYPNQLQSYFFGEKNEY